MEEPLGGSWIPTGRASSGAISRSLGLGARESIDQAPDVSLGVLLLAFGWGSYSLLISTSPSRVILLTSKA